MYTSAKVVDSIKCYEYIDDIKCYEYIDNKIVDLW